MTTKKIPNDKYYTPSSLAEYCVSKAKEIIGEQNITEYLEPSGGAGVFLDYLPEGTYSCDIEPEDERVVQGDFLQLDLPYKQGRCIIGNPPYGIKGNLFTQFYNKACELGDYIAFILPISQYNNDIKLYRFDLLYSEDLGKREYSGIKVHCCLNIYHRPNGGGYNQPRNYRLKDIEVVELRIAKKSMQSKNRNRVYNGFAYDYAICAWGASIGKEIKHENQFAKEFYFVIHNDKLKNKILDVLQNADWCKEYPMTATPNLLQWQAYKYLKKMIPEIE